MKLGNWEAIGEPTNCYPVAVDQYVDVERKGLYAYTVHMCGVPIGALYESSNGLLAYSSEDAMANARGGWGPYRTLDRAVLSIIAKL